MTQSSNHSEKVERVVTPLGIASFPYLRDPDTKFSAEGVYKVDLLLDPEIPENKAFLSLLDKHLAAWQGKAAEQGRSITQWNPVPYETHTDADGNPTGLVKVKIKRAASGVSRKNGKPWKKPLNIFDDKLQLIESASPGPGSKIKVSLDIMAYQSSNKGGIRLSPAGVQVIEMAGNDDDPESLGFGSPEPLAGAEDFGQPSNGDF